MSRLRYASFRSRGERKMQTVAIEEAQAHLAELIEQLKPGQELIITRDQKPVARLSAISMFSPPRKLGTMKGTVLHMAANFDALPDDSQESTK
jgi:antitoxin (DNA-binding transcriptional repressor) of toxin-antitoxin stability system